jgi:DNA repair protein RecO (recombination protein O)
MLIKTKGIVFRTVKYAESSIIADIYTESKGLQQYLVHGVRSQNARTKASLFQIMSWVDLVAYYRQGRDLHSIREIRSAYVYQSIPFDVHKGAVGMFMAEIARKTIREEEPNPALYAFLFETFTFLDGTAQQSANIHLSFLLNLCGYLGFMPGGEFSADTPIFDLQEGYFIENTTPSAVQLDQEQSELVYQLLQLPITDCHEIKMNRQQRNLLLDRLLDYYRFHIEQFPTIHSHQILQDVLG